MMNNVILALCAVMGYLLGSVNTSIIVSKCMGKDIRSMGSGNAGTTNTLRSLGKIPALIVLLGDALKGIIAMVLATGILIIYCQYAGINRFDDPALLLTGYAAAVACVLGHNFPVFFGFRGGKGVLTSIVVVMVIDWRCAVISLAVFVIILLISRYVSLSSMVAAAATPVAAFLYPPTAQNAFAIFEKNVNIAVFTLLAVLLIIRHHGNIRRLLSGTENKLGAKNKKE